MKSKKLISLKATTKVALACVAIGWMCWSVGNVCNAQTPPSNLSPDLQEVVKLSQEKMSDDVITNYIRNSGKSFKLGADEIIYLNSQGVSQGVISALLQTASSANPTPSPVVSSPTPPPPPPSQPSSAPYVANNVPSAPDSGPPPAPPTEVPQAGPEINFQYFHDQLAPWGTWVEAPGIGPCWQPGSNITGISPDWRPYYDNGQWVQTDNGLFWQSDYTWGDIPFHYGRWIRNPVYGWVWVPDYTWGPAWVFWRQAEGDAAIGWAPLPVGAVFVGGVLMFNGVAVAAEFDFGLGETCFVFVGYDHFHEGFFRMKGHEWPYHIGQERLHGFYSRSVIRNDFRRDEHGRLVNNGIGRERLDHIAQMTHHPIGKVSFEERHPVGNRELLAKERSEHLAPAKTGQPGAGNAGHPGEITVGSHFAGGNAGTTGHPGAGQPDWMAGKSNGGLKSSSVSKVFRPPTTGSTSGNNSSHGNPGKSAPPKGNSGKK